MTSVTMQQNDYQLPVLEGYTQEFYAFCKKHELRFQRCARCKTWRHPPRPLCNRCYSFETEWAPVKGTGKLYCWTVPMVPIGKVWGSSMPYVAAIVELDEGPRMATWITDIPHEQLCVGTPVRVWFDVLTPEVTLAKFRPAD